MDVSFLGVGDMNVLIVKIMYRAVFSHEWTQDYLILKVGKKSCLKLSQI